MTRDPYKYFRVEARELAEQLGAGVLALEKGPASPEIVQRLLRCAHTLKGAARVVKQPEIADAAHAIEEALAPFRDSSQAVPLDRADALLRLIDEISKRVSALSPGAESRAPSGARSGAEDSFRSLRADVTEMDALLDGLAEAHVQLAAIREGLRSLGRIQSIAAALAGQGAAQAQGPAAASARTRSQAEELRRLVSSLALKLATGTEYAGREINQAREIAERLRLISASIVFGSLERTARDTARAAGKQVVFEGKGGEVRLDAHVLEVVQGALLQIVRNAVAHGIEPENVRRAAGKPPEGRVEIEVMRRGNRVAFVCRDDGRGVDVKAIRSAAGRKGLLPADAQKLGPAELLRVLLKGGITTASAVTEISGRGIGLDVVREAAERLSGEVQVETKSGVGTAIEVIVPLSLSSMDALIVEAGGIRAAIPLDAVSATLRAASGELTRAAGGETILYEGRAIPFIPLERSLARNGHKALSPKMWSAAVIRSGANLAAVGVDKLLGIDNVVLRPLPSLAPADPVVAGACLDAGGNPQIVLDAGGLVSLARGPGQVAPRASQVRPPVLIIDDSLTTRMLEQSILEGAGYAADAASSGEEALAKAHKQTYALFLVDIEMPGMDGFTFVERARADPALRDVPSIIVTSRSSPEDRRRAEEAGACAYIIKSEFDQTDLLERIRKLVN